MAKVKTTGSTQKRRPALTPEGREAQMISYAENLAEQQLRDGTASSQVIVHYLKLATTKAQLENEKLKQENEVLKAKAAAIASQKSSEELYEKAIKAMRNYGGMGDPDEYRD